MADFLVYDRNGRFSGVHKDPEAAIAQARRLAQQTGDYADVVKHGTHSRRRFFASGRVATIRTERRAAR